MPLIGVGGSTFSGGTLTSGLTLSPSNKDATALQIRPVAGASADYTPEIALYDDAGHEVALLDAGTEYLFALSTLLGGAFTVLAGTSIAAGQALLTLSPTSDVQITAPAGGNTVILGVGVVGTTHPVLWVGSVGGNDLTPAIGFFGASPVGRQTLHSATATPESLALALEASTLMTGD